MYIVQKYMYSATVTLDKLITNGIESVLFLCTWSVMQLLRQTSTGVVRSQVNGGVVMQK